MKTIRALWGYRGFITGSVNREFQANYKNSILGATWSVIRPLTLIVVYTVVFSQVMQAKLPTLGKEYAYSVYLCAGLLTWNYFVEAVTRGQNIFLENANLLKKVNFPVLTMSVIAMANAMVSLGIIFGLFLIFLVATGSFPGLVFVAIFPVLLIQTLLAFGLGLTLGILNVFFRDVGQLFGVVLQFWFWLTPIVYPASILPVWAQQLIAYNPMTSIATAYQTILVNAQMPDWRSLWPVTLLAITLCVLGLRIYHKHASEMVDEL